MEPTVGMESPGDLLSLLQGGGEEQSPDLQELMGAVQRMQAGRPAEGAGDADQVLVFPDPGFVVKTVDEQGRKVFINVCGSPKLGLPHGWEAGKMPEETKKALEAMRSGSGGGASGGGSLEPEGSAGSSENSELLRFPLSMAAPREDSDHRGERCTVIDCILNSGVLNEAAAYRPLKYYLIHLVMAWAEQKNGLQLDPHYKLPRMRYKGDAPHPQYIKQEGPEGKPKGKALISEVEPAGGEEPAFPLLAAGASSQCGKGGGAGASQRSAGAAGTAGTAARPAEQKGAAGAAALPSPPPGGASASGAAGSTSVPQPGSTGRQLQHTLEYLGRPVEAVRLLVQLPTAAGGTPATAAAAGSTFAAGSAEGGPPLDPSSVTVEVAPHAVHVAVPGWQPLAVELPFAVGTQGASAELAPGGRELRLTLPYRPFREVHNQLQQSAPLKFGALGLSSSPLLELD